MLNPAPLQDRTAALASLRAGARRACGAVRAIRSKGLTPQQRRVVAVCCALGVLGLGFCALMAWLIGTIAADPSGLARLVGENQVLTGALYALINMLKMFAAFIPGEPLELVGGYLFGMWGGLAVVGIGIAAGGAAVFCIVKRFGTRVVRLFVSAEKLERFTLFNDARRLNVVTFLLMFIPGTPKDLVTYVVGLTPMTLPTWLLISIPARTLSILVSTAVGAQAAADNWALAAGMFALTCVVSMLGMAYYVIVSRQARQDAIMDELGRIEWEQAGCRTNDAGSAAGA